MNQAVLITGGAQRVGRAIALFFARKGFDVALHYRKSRRQAESLKRDIGRLGVRCSLFAGDFNQTRASGKLISKVRSQFKHLSVLINNASVFEPSRLKNTTDDLFWRQMKVNFAAPFILTRDFARVTRQGQIINLLDCRIAYQPVDHLAYTLSKKALADLTVLAAHDLAPLIRVNAVALGPILPPRGQKRAMQLRSKMLTLLKRRGTVEDVVRGIDYLLSNPYVTGQILFIDGGKHVSCGNGRC